MMESRARRPGGRTAEVRAKINQAVLDLLVEGGSDACTFKSVSDRAQVERSTLYRRYPDRWEMMIDAFMATAAADVMPDLGESLADDLTTVLQKLAGQLASPLGAALLSVVAGLRANAGPEFSRAYFDRRVAQLDPMFDAALARGELPATVDRETLFTYAAGPIYFRIFVAGRAMDDDFIRTLVSAVCSNFSS